VIDRKKNIFKLAQGEYVAPEKLENVYTKSEYIAQSFVHGDSLQSELVAVIVPEAETVIAWAKKNSIPLSGTSPEADLRELCKMAAFRDLIFTEVNYLAKKYKLAGYVLRLSNRPLSARLGSTMLNGCFCVFLGHVKIGLRWSRTFIWSLSFSLWKTICSRRRSN
jgi:long-subunit acyl-CoA synthetase (AMP-forming)